jgi:hypothetical protein
MSVSPKKKPSKKKKEFILHLTRLVCRFYVQYWQYLSMFSLFIPSFRLLKHELQRNWS